VLELAAGDYRLVLQAKLGGSVATFHWRDKPVFRPACGPSVLDTACFPLAPFSNRIAHGRFSFGGREVALAPNFPDSDHPHPLHGFGWLAAWETPISVR
jgi:aldose 1-epimerase